MNEEQVIGDFFQNENMALEYVRNRLLGNFEKAPPQISDRFIEEFPADFLQRLILALEKKEKGETFWNVCLQLFQEWRDPEQANPESSKGLSELVRMILQIDRHHEELFRSARENWHQELNHPQLKEGLYDTHEKNLVHAQNLSLVNAWGLWPDRDMRWSMLYENILCSDNPDDEAQYEIMLIVTQRLTWDIDKTRKLFEWTMNRNNLPGTFYSQYMFHCLCGCGNHKTETDIAEQRRCQTKLVKNVLKAQQPFLFRFNDREKTRKLGESLSEASKIFRWKSFKCLDEKRLELLDQEINKLVHPPSPQETSLTRTGCSTTEYMSSKYSNSPSLAA